ncbi:restriction endonuclease subunit S [Pontibacter pamirensis]|uniref:restriction endonuclease subunit S n=1 Tax=Pontibacter pamirensis TaxID=2562824 RepID=UPI00138970DE|nr:restriction endonuclease subunit S [Pontibacter pamirensis]
MLLLEQFEHLTLHPKNTARLKELVLQLAVQGKLTENWRRHNPDVEPANELLQRIEAEKAQLIKEKKIKREKPLEAILEDEVPFTLPESWDWCKFQSIQVEAQAGLERSKSLQSVSYKYGYFKMNNIGADGRTDLSNIVRVEANEEEVQKYELKIGDFLFNSRNSKELVGKTTVFLGVKESTPVLYNNNIIRVRFASDVDPKFINYWFASPPAYKLKQSLVTATTNVAALYQGQLMSFTVPLPPLAEQEAIVARVEELMQKIEELERQTSERIQLKQHLGTAALQQLTAATDNELEQNWLFLEQHFQTMFDEAANVKKLRETILQLAVQGKLTSTWRNKNSTTEPASELLERIQKQKVKLIKEKKIKKEKPLEPISKDELPYTLPEGWVWCKLGSITNYGTSEKVEPKQADDGLWVLELEDVEKSTSRLLQKIRYSDRNFQSTKSRFFKGDVVYGKLRPYLDKVIVADEDGVCTTEMIPFRGYGDINSYFLRLSLKVPSFIKYANDSTHGMNLPRMGTDKAREAVLALPPLAEQEAIVAKVNQLMQLCDELEQHIQQSKQEAEALMQAVVQEALQVQEEAIV